MKKRIPIVTLITICLFVFTAYFLRANADSSSRPPKTADDQHPALQNPDKFAWEMFVEINKPAQSGSSTSTWETWASDEDVFDNPNVTPVWPGSATPTGFAITRQRKRLRPIRQLVIGNEELRSTRRLQQRERLQRNKKDRGPQVNFIPPQIGSGEEVRMNKATFDFIVANNLWYIQGQETAFQNNTKIDFPVESKEVKAIWQPISEGDKERFHWAPNPADGNKPYGMVALHVISKDLPNWTWATFEQVDNPERCLARPCHDSFGVTASGDVSPELQGLFQAAGLGPEWQFYRLTGMQVDFVDASGQPTILGNSVIENPFRLSSSCITCHSRSTIGPRIGAGANRLSVFQPRPPVPPPPIPPDRLISYNGMPDPTWFFTNPQDPTTRKYLQLDFLWSLRNARRRTIPS